MKTISNVFRVIFLSAVAVSICEVGMATSGEAPSLLNCEGKFGDGSATAKFSLKQTQKPVRNDRGQFWIETFDKRTKKFSINYLLQDETSFEFMITEGSEDGKIPADKTPLSLTSKKFVMDSDVFCLVDDRDRCRVVVDRKCRVSMYGMCGYYPSSNTYRDLRGDPDKCITATLSELEGGSPLLK